MLLQTDGHRRLPLRHPGQARFRHRVRRRSTPGPENRHDPDYGRLGLATSGSARRRPAPGCSPRAIQPRPPFPTPATRFA